MCLGENGLFVHMPRGGLIIDCTTSYLASTIALAEEAQEHGISFIDAPVKRSPEQQENAFHWIRPSLKAFLLHFVRPFLMSAMSDKVTRSLVYNSMTMGIAAVAAEVWQFAHGLDLDLVILHSLIGRGSINSGIFQAFVAFLLGEKPDVGNINCEFGKGYRVRFALSRRECSVGAGLDCCGAKIPCLSYGG